MQFPGCARQELFEAMTAEEEAELAAIIDEFDANGGEIVDEDAPPEEADPPQDKSLE